jgi:hypothetical protein
MIPMIRTPMIGMMLAYDVTIDGERWRAIGRVEGFLLPLEPDGSPSPHGWMVQLSVEGDNGGPWASEWAAWCEAVNATANLAAEPGFIDVLLGPPVNG